MLTFLKKRNRNSIRIRQITQHQTEETSEVSALVDGFKVWFRAKGGVLRPDALAFVCAYLFCSQKTGRSLHSEQQIPLKRRAHLAKIAKLTSEWWSSPALKEMEFGKRPDIDNGRGTRTGLLFSCGIDSFASLIENGDEIDDLILVHGFDVGINDIERFTALKTQAEVVAGKAGKRLIVVETNLREHRVFGLGKWDHQHGSALAAVGHLLADEIGHLLISASYPSANLQPWGSHPLLDHLWSSGSLRIQHSGDDLWRNEKIERYGRDPVLLAHLAVCWRGTGVPLNCGNCKKCVRNHLGFRLMGFKTPETFPKDLDLAEAIDSVPKIPVVSNIYALALKSACIDDPIKEAIKGLLERSNLDLADESTKDESTKELGVRYEGGSPNRYEIGAYASYLPEESICQSGTAVVLGMTPELRHLAASRFRQVIAVDKGSAAIETYRNWLPEELRAKERIYAVDWRHLSYMDWTRFPPVRAVLGDGIFANSPDESTQGAFLSDLRELFPRASMIFRKALAEYGSDSDSETLETLRIDFRSDRITADEFGFCVRLQGFLNDAYDADSAILDNSALSERCDAFHAEGYFNEKEIEAIRRFQFTGPNCLLTEQRWEKLLTERQIDFEKTRLQGKRWFSFYPIYHLKSGQR